MYNLCSQHCHLGEDDYYLGHISEYLDKCSTCPICLASLITGIDSHVIDMMLRCYTPWGELFRTLSREEIDKIEKSASSTRIKMAQISAYAMARGASVCDDSGHNIGVAMAERARLNSGYAQ